MRREYVTFQGNLPLTISLQEISHYPLHWHNCLEIIFVLKGTVFVQIESEIYNLKEREIEIINPDEPHKIYSQEKNNRILLFRMDLDFFEKYYSDVKDIYFYTDSSREGVQQKKSIRSLENF